MRRGNRTTLRHQFNWRPAKRRSSGLRPRWFKLCAWIAAAEDEDKSSDFDAADAMGDGGGPGVCSRVVRRRQEGEAETTERSQCGLVGGFCPRPTRGDGNLQRAAGKRRQRSESEIKGNQQPRLGGPKVGTGNERQRGV